jgi:ATP-dependent RNA helicase DDX52/ROK1
MGYGLDHHDDAADEGKQHDVDRTTRRSSGCDMLVVAPTGSGKTLSYLLPLILKLGLPARTLLASTQVPQGNSHDDDDVEDGTGIRAIVLLPTHELATQIHNEVLKLVVPARSASASHSHSHAEDEDDAARKSKTDQAWRVMLLEKATEAAVIASSSSATATSEQRDKRLGIDVLVATPERLHSLVDKGKVDLGR